MPNVAPQDSARIGTLDIDDACIISEQESPTLADILREAPENLGSHYIGDPRYIEPSIANIDFEVRSSIPIYQLYQSHYNRGIEALYPIDNNDEDRLQYCMFPEMGISNIVITPLSELSAKVERLKQKKLDYRCSSGLSAWMNSDTGVLMGW